MDSFIQVIGCGDAFSSAGRANSCFLVKHKAKTILLDCGATTLARLKELGHKTSEINLIAISHFHGDHYGGLPALILDREFGEKRSEDLVITCPAGGKERITKLVEAMYPGNEDLVDKQPIKFFYYEENDELKFDSFSISGFPVDHAPLSLPHGIRLTLDNFIIAYSGDSRWTENLIPLADNSDLFILDCNFLEPTQAAHLDYQTLTQNLNKLRSKRICLTHMGLSVINSSQVMFEKLTDGQMIPLP